MSSVLILRERSFKPSESALLEHQAIYNITRSIVTSFSTEGPTISEHKIILPAHLDILPLIALVANDYTEIVEPEPQRIPREVPFILYDAQGLKEDEYGSIMTVLLRCNSFITKYLETDLSSLIYDLKPETCIIIGEGTQKLNSLMNLNYSFQHIVVFSVFSPDLAFTKYSSVAKYFTVADETFTTLLREGARKVDIMYENIDQFSQWSRSYANGESKPDLEPLIHFGAATEIALFTDKDNKR